MTRALLLAVALTCCIPASAPALIQAKPMTAAVATAPHEDRDVLWMPNPGPQTQFLSSRANEVLYGGAAGGGKSAASIALPLRWVDHPRFRALFLRRESKYLGDAVDKSSNLYPLFGARFVKSPKMVWTFPSGAQVWLSHCEHEKDVRNYDSYEFHLVIFEELTHFTEKQYRAIRARIRGTDPALPRYTRSTTNPGGEGHEWVFRRFGPWLDPESPVRAAPGEVLWFRDEEVVPRGTDLALSRQFIPATLDDNPHVTDEYRAQLLDLDHVRRAQLLNGNWLIKPAKGLYFKRAWFGVVDAAPAQVTKRVRYWDLAGSPTGDWAVGTRMSKTADGLFVVEHVERLRGTPGDIRARVKATAELDGRGTHIWLEQDPGQAGKDQMQSYATMLNGYVVHPRPKRVDKVTGAGPFSSQVEAGNVKLVRGAWNEPFIAVLEAFPEGEHDDDVDSASGAHAVLSGLVAPSFSGIPTFSQPRSI